ncbi:MAG: type II toxin-antitoxin system HipA family toxin [Solirubrobacterales bacterium]|nr:type II toxin-antitoxin system HipA family toxin [Solirubrobacterales bacterium]
MTPVEIRYQGRRVGAAFQESPSSIATFEFTPEFVAEGPDLSPIQMPLRPGPYSFPTLGRDAFRGLPGLLADALPDKFGNLVIDRRFAARGTPPESLTATDRLSYVGARAMGALEFVPATGPTADENHSLDIEALRSAAADILSEREDFATELDGPDAAEDILQVGTSAGGARAKALIAWNPDTNEVRSGQVDAGDGFGYWLIKLDGAGALADRELNEPEGYGLIEYAYYLMAKAAGIEMTECRIFKEADRSHFMTRRFDRTEDGSKIHQQSLGGLCHFDFNLDGAYSYEQALLTIRQLDIGAEAREQQFRRMLFNVVARNQDDHVKNISFLMNSDGEWSLSPAYDVTYSYNPGKQYTRMHQMTINDKRDGFVLDDFRQCANSALLKRGQWEEILEQVIDAVLDWPHFANEAGVSPIRAARIAGTHRLGFDSK